ncbi:hypothetical protein ON010_g2635 [Phytophthora cinnamomi]|nr:hypothetical protein ON010_g2635 [Phytophthora cinnamomi]
MTKSSVTLFELPFFAEKAIVGKFFIAWDFSIADILCVLLQIGFGDRAINRSGQTAPQVINSTTQQRMEQEQHGRHANAGKGRTEEQQHEQAAWQHSDEGPQKLCKRLEAVAEEAAKHE